MKEKIKNFYFENRNLLGIIFEITLVIGFFLLINKDKYLFEIFYYSILILFSLFWFYEIDSTETWILKNFTRIMFIGVGLLFSYQKSLGIDNKETLLMIGGIIAFWYGYKKYEKDKEIEMINTLNLKENIDELIIDWKLKRVLYEKGYIKDYIWNIIESNYQTRFHEYIGEFNFEEFEKKFTIDRFTIINMGLIISKLKTYEGAKDYFINQIKLIQKILNGDIMFFKKLNENKYKSRIIYYENLNFEIGKILKKNY